MKTLDMTRRLNAVAENLKDLEIKDTTRIDWRCLTQGERLLFEKITEIKEEYWPQVPPDNVLEENHALFVKGIEIIVRRTLDLFQSVVKTSYLTSTRDDPLIDFIFTTRLYWFLHEMHRHAERIGKEGELYERYEKFEDFERAWKDYEEKLEDKTALWSKESFERFVQPLFERMYRSHGNHG